QAPASGIWEMQKNGKIKFKKMDAHRQSVVGDNEAFYLQITQKDNYFYEGADLGILVLRGRLMSDDFKLSERGKRWIKALRDHYRADIIDAGSLDINELYEADGFKMM
ncbi:MAG: biotin carboxylase, partial [Bacteroidia bacterium]